MGILFPTSKHLYLIYTGKLRFHLPQKNASHVFGKLIFTVEKIKLNSLKSCYSNDI